LNGRGADDLRAVLARVTDVIADLEASVRELRATSTRESLELKARVHALDARLSGFEEKRSRRKPTDGTSTAGQQQAAVPAAKTGPPHSERGTRERARVASELRAKGKTTPTLTERRVDKRPES